MKKQVEARTFHLLHDRREEDAAGDELIIAAAGQPQLIKRLQNTPPTKHSPGPITQLTESAYGEQHQQREILSNIMMAGLQCPRCFSDALYSYGRIKSGKRRYLCLVCNRQFVSDASRQAIDKRPLYPLCGANMHIYRREGNHIRFRCAAYFACRGFAKLEMP